MLRTVVQDDVDESVSAIRRHILPLRKRTDSWTMPCTSIGHFPSSSRWRANQYALHAGLNRHSLQCSGWGVARPAASSDPP